MRTYLIQLSAMVLLVILSSYSWGLQVDDTSAAPDEWGFHPAAEEECHVSPPGFVWRPQKNAAHYHLQVSLDSDFSTILYYDKKAIADNVHTPAKVFPPGEKYYWRFRYTTEEGTTSQWSQIRAFTILPNPNKLPLPAKEDLLDRIPTTHPRLFLRPEDIAELRQRRKKDLKPIYDRLVAVCDALVENPPSTKEPPRYPEGMVRKSEGWREIWWGNRRQTIKVLNGAATLGFTWLLNGNDTYGQLAKQLLLECAQWDPKGATGYRYNDEAGMPYNYYFSRTYTFINPLLSEKEKEICRDVMRIRGREMYDHLYPRQYWKPYESHRNRAWHFLGEIGIAFYDEIPEAQDWIWFAMNVFTNVYPVWSDAYGGWHEGVRYWRSYISRFTWWADIMKAATGIDAYQKPYFSQIGYYPLYLHPPGTDGGGFGDLNANTDSRGNLSLLSTLVAQNPNPHWQWYLDAHNYEAVDSLPELDEISASTVRGWAGYADYVRGIGKSIQGKAPTDIPSSRCFWGIGQAYLNTNLVDAEDNVEILFKSSPFGARSHGYEAQNSFLLYAYGERLLIRTGKRDVYGSKHHRHWMWETKSTNCITVNGEGQPPHSPFAMGKITNFISTDEYSYVEGEAASAYPNDVERFTRRILLLNPDTIVIYDTLETEKPAEFTWWLHSPTKFEIIDQYNINSQNNDASCDIKMLWPPDLHVEQTDQFDPPPRERIQLVEHHLTATTSSRTNTQDFITLLHPTKNGKRIKASHSLKQMERGYVLKIKKNDQEIMLLLQPETNQEFTFNDLSVRGSIGGIISNKRDNTINKIDITKE